MKLQPRPELEIRSTTSTFYWSEFPKDKQIGSYDPDLTKSQPTNHGYVETQDNNSSSLYQTQQTDFTTENATISIPYSKSDAEPEKNLEKAIEHWNKFEFKEATKIFEQNLSPESSLFLIVGSKLELFALHSLSKAKAQKLLLESESYFHQKLKSNVKKLEEHVRIALGCFLMEYNKKPSELWQKGLEILERYTLTPFTHLYIGKDTHYTNRDKSLEHYKKAVDGGLKLAGLHMSRLLQQTVSKAHINLLPERFHTVPLLEGAVSEGSLEAALFLSTIYNTVGDVEKAMKVLKPFEDSANTENGFRIAEQKRHVEVAMRRDYELATVSLSKSSLAEAYRLWSPIAVHYPSAALKMLLLHVCDITELEEEVHSKLLHLLKNCDVSTWPKITCNFDDHVFSKICFSLIVENDPVKTLDEISQLNFVNPYLLVLQGLAYKHPSINKLEKTISVLETSISHNVYLGAPTLAKLLLSSPNPDNLRIAQMMDLIGTGSIPRSYPNYMAGKMLCEGTNGVKRELQRGLLRLHHATGYADADELFKKYSAEQEQKINPDKYLPV